MEKFVQKEKLLFPEILWQKPVYAFHKAGGNLLIIGGSGLENQKVLFTADAAFRSGTGFLTMAFPKSLEETYKKFISKEMTLPLPETPSRSLSLKSKKEILEFSDTKKVIILGPGLSKNSETVQLSFELFKELDGTLILCDDMIRTLIMSTKLIHDKEGTEGVKEFFHNIEAEKIILILTKEQLDKLKFLSPEKDLIKKIQEICDFLNSEIILVDKDVLYTTAERQLKNQIPLEDIKEKEICALAGIVSSFLSQNENKKFEAIATAVYIFSKTKVEEKTFSLKNISKMIKEEEYQSKYF